MDTTDGIRDEVEAIHRAFVDWFNGTAENSAATFAERIERRFAPDFSMVPPSGQLVERDPLLGSLFGAHGGHRGIEIQIRDVRLLHDFGDHVVASYEEWQRSPTPREPQITGRTSTAILRRRDDAWQWVHVHETWLGPEAILLSPFAADA